MTNWSKLAKEIDKLEEDFWYEPHERPTLEVDIADGGYLSWLYGSSILRHQAWPPKFHGKKPIVVMDSRTVLYRRLRSPHYKLNRESKREDDEKMQARTKMVRDFRQLVEEEDGRFKFVRIEGLEADDLVALATWLWNGTDEKPVRLMGIDKDFLQVEGLRISDKDNVPVTLSRFQERLPKACQEPRMTRPWQVPLTLALLGDKSDGVPRILAPRTPGLSFLASLFSMTQAEAYLAAYEHYGEDFARNLYDVALPDPYILGFNVDDCLEAFVTERWTSKLWRKVWPHVQQEVLSWAS